MAEACSGHRRYRVKAMPTYEYECVDCRIIYRTEHGMNDRPEIRCQECRKPATRMISAPNLSLHGYTSPTQAKYAKMSDNEEIARENKLQDVYRHIWLPPEVKHDPADEH